MGQVVSFINMKGGVGKTTLAVNVAYALAYQHHKRVLLWGGPGALDSFWVKLRCAVLTETSGPRHPSQVSRGRKAASTFCSAKRLSSLSRP